MIERKTIPFNLRPDTYEALETEGSATFFL